MNMQPQIYILWNLEEVWELLNVEVDMHSMQISTGASANKVSAPGICILLFKRVQDQPG